MITAYKLNELREVLLHDLAFRSKVDCDLFRNYSSEMSSCMEDQVNRDILQKTVKEFKVICKSQVIVFKDRMQEISNIILYIKRESGSRMSNQMTELVYDTVFMANELHKALQSHLTVVNEALSALEKIG